MKTQLEELTKYFKRNSRLTQHQAFEMGIMRLSERIRELESQGWVFLHNRIEVPTRYTKAFVTQYVLLQRPKKKV